MAKRRVYVPSTLTLLREAFVSGGVGPQPVLGHAVTEAVRTELPGSSEEEWEYVALVAAAQDAVGLLGEGDAQRRVVIAVDAPSVRSTDHPTRVELDEVVPVTSIAAVLVDDEAAADDVAMARKAWSDAVAGDAEAEAVLERCLDRELGWYAAQEVGDLLGG
jgi:hypothetical protein